MLHIKRVVHNAARIADAEGSQIEVLLPASWLHDCVDVPKDSPQRSAASRLSADQAIMFLEEREYPSEHFDGIHHAIVAHSFSAKVVPETIEAKVLQDADRLDAVGALGLSRCLMLGGHMQKPLMAEKDPFCRDRSPDDSLFTIDHFYTKLLTLSGTMQTETGRKIAAERTEFLIKYLEQLESEVLP
jgi:uncharacterized protein